jgi:hypothetical protein
MGKGFFFGKKAQPETSSSGNQAYGEINSAFSPNFGFTNQAGSMLSNLLGIGGGPAQTDALNNFANSGGMQFLRDQGNNQIDSNQAAKGLLQSGDTLKELDKYGQGLGSTYLNSFMQHLGTLGQLGLGSGALVADAGKYSKQSGPTAAKPGLAQIALQAIGGAVGGPPGAAAGSAIGGGLGDLFGSSDSIDAMNGGPLGGDMGPFTLTSGDGGGGLGF